MSERAYFVVLGNVPRLLVFYIGKSPYVVKNKVSKLKLYYYS